VKFVVIGSSEGIVIVLGGVWGLCCVSFFGVFAAVRSGLMRRGNELLEAV
jgi:hypothetical protein